MKSIEVSPFHLLFLLAVILFLLATGCTSPSSPAAPASTPLEVPSTWDPADKGTEDGTVLPGFVIAAALAAVPGGTVVAATREDEDGRIVYDVLVETEEGAFEVDVAADGTVVEVEEAAEDERPVAPADLPQAVLDAVERTVPGGRITEAVRESVRGRVIYDVEVDVRGRKFDLEVAPDGTVLEVDEGN